jgi:hypothetical protein
MGVPHDGVLDQALQVFYGTIPLILVVVGIHLARWRLVKGHCA